MSGKGNGKEKTRGQGRNPQAGGKKTLVSLLQDNNATEEAREHPEKNWNVMLGDMKKFLEK